MVDFKESQKKEELMWSKYGTVIKDILTLNNPNSKIERINGMLDYSCGIDAVILNPIGVDSIRFVSLRMIKGFYDTLTFRIPHTNSKKELFKLLSPHNPAPYYHVQITEGNKGTQVVILNINKLSKYVIANPEFWNTISNYIVKAERNNFYAIPIKKLKRFCKVTNIGVV